jgi:hypothetical protein
MNRGNQLTRSPQNPVRLRAIRHRTGHPGLQLPLPLRRRALPPQPQALQDRRPLVRPQTRTLDTARSDRASDKPRPGQPLPVRCARSCQRGRSKWPLHHLDRHRRRNTGHQSRCWLWSGSRDRRPQRSRWHGLRCRWLGIDMVNPSGRAESGGRVSGGGCASPTIVGPGACFEADQSGGGAGIGLGTQANFKYEQEVEIF